MAKKKKKDKLTAEDIISNYTLDSALKTSKTTESTLHNLLQTVSEDKGFITPKEEEVRIEPQLSYETKRKIAEDYLLEDKPLSEREPVEERSKIKITPSEEIKSDIQQDKALKTGIQSEEKPKSEAQTNEKPKTELQSGEEPVIAETMKKEPYFSKKDSIYAKLAKFFEELFEGYLERYDRWEYSISSILSILRKMRKITKKNSEDLVQSIDNMYKTIQFNLENFKLKRDEVERIADVDVESMSSEFKKVLGLLELQVKEYQFKLLTDEYVRENNPIM